MYGSLPFENAPDGGTSLRQRRPHSPSHSNLSRDASVMKRLYKSAAPAKHSAGMELPAEKWSRGAAAEVDDHDIIPSGIRFPNSRHSFVYTMVCRLELYLLLFCVFTHHI